MSKDRVYSWRVSTQALHAMEREATYCGMTTSELLARITAAWLKEREEERAGDEAGQARIRAAARRAIGAIAGGDARRSERAREAIRRRLRAQRAG